MGIVTINAIFRKPNPINQCGKYEGQYNLIIKKNEIALIDEHGNEGVAKCHPDDKFDFNTGIVKAMERLKEKQNEIHVGDYVEIVDSGCSYTQYNAWILKNVEDKKLLVKYGYTKIPENGTRCIVEKIAPHEDSKNVMLYYVRDYRLNDVCYLLNSRGLKKVY